MGVMFWAGLMAVTLVSLLAVNPLMLGFCMLGSSIMMSVLVSYFSFSWYAFMFFLMYMGGLLVLFFYMASLKSKPVFKVLGFLSGVGYMSITDMFFMVFYNLSGKLMFLFVFFSFFCYSWVSISSSFFKKVKVDFSGSLFKSSEVWFLFLVIFILLLVLWVMTKLTFRSRGALRPFY